MQIPVMGYRYRTNKPLAFATLDPEDVAAMEKFAQKKLVLQFGRTGEVQVNICYVEFLFAPTELPLWEASVYAAKEKLF